MKGKDKRYPNLGVYVGSKKILGTRFGFDAVFPLVHRLPKQSTLVFLAKTIWVLETWGGTNADLQNAIAAFLFPDKLPQIKNILDGGVNAIFFQPQILTLMKLLLMYGNHKPDDLNLKESDSNKIGLALLGINDGIERQFRYLHKEPDEKDLIKEVALEVSLASFIINNPRIGLSLIRAIHLYINIQRQLAVQKSADYIDIEGLFEEATGLRLTEYLSLGIAILVHYLPNWKVGEFPQDPSFIYLKPRELFANSKVGLEKIKQMINTISGSIDLHSKLLEDQTDRELNYDFITFHARPLIELGEGLYVPISVQYLLDRMTMGVYWIIFDYLKGKDAKEHLKFMNYHGQLFQKYVEEIVSVIIRRDRIAQIVIDQEYRVGKKLLKTPDLVLFQDDCIILIEASATRLQAKRTVALGNRDAFVDDFCKIILHNAESLDTYIQNIKQGYGLPENVDLSNKVIYPVIVTIEGFIPHPIMSIYIDEVLREKKLLSDKQVAPLSILAIDELEELEGYSDLGLSEVLRMWLSRGLGRPPLTTFMRASNRTRGLESDWLKKIQKQIFNEATLLIFGKELKDIEDRS